MTPRAFVDTWFENVWNQGSEEHIAQMLSPNAVIHGLPSCGAEADAIADFTQFQRTILNAIRETHIEVTRFVSEGDQGVGFAKVTGVDAKSGGPVCFQLGFWFRIENDLIVEVENIVDFLTYLTDCGCVTADALAGQLA